MGLRGSSCFANVLKLAEAGTVPNEVQVLRVGSFSHPKYGRFNITPVTLAEMKTNFDNRVRGIDTAFDFFHDSDKEASAWVKNLELREDGTELWAFVEWTPKATKQLAEREVRYFSPDFAFQWTDPESQKVYSNVLFGGGLTNRPFVKEMAAIVATEPKGGNKMDELKELQAKNLKLAEDLGAAKKMADAIPAKDAQIADMQKQIDELKVTVAKMCGENETMLTEKKALAEKLQCAEKESKFNILLSEGKACVAQKDAYMKGDFEAFAKLSEKVNSQAQGSGAKGEDVNINEDKVIELAEAKVKANPSLKLHEAMSEVLREQNQK